MSRSCLFALLLAAVKAWHVTQTDDFYQIEVDESQVNPDKALAIQVDQLGTNSTHILLLASQDDIKFEFNDSSGWTVKYQYLHFEGWALGQQNFTLVIPAGDLDPSKSLKLGFYKLSESPAEYNVTLQPQEPDSCGPDCDNPNVCQESICNCHSEEMMGEYCNINATQLEFHDKRHVALGSEEWAFFQVPIENVTEMTLGVSVSEGTPHLFLLNATDLKYPPSMFNNYSDFVKPEEKEELSYKFDENSLGHLYLSAYCPDSCLFTLLFPEPVSRSSIPSYFVHFL